MEARLDDKWIFIADFYLSTSLIIDSRLGLVLLFRDHVVKLRGKKESVKKGGDSCQLYLNARSV